MNNDWTEQTEIAKQLGISNNKFRKMIRDKAEFILLCNKRHYRFSDVLTIIDKARQEQSHNGR